MKINRVKAEKKAKTNRKSDFFLNIYYFLQLYRMLALSILGIGIAALIILLVLDLMIPSQLKDIDQNTTLKLFDQLQEAGRHQDAISLMEYKGKILDNTPLELEYKTKLSDSYIHVGDYSKAEKMLLDVWNHAPKYIQEIDGNTRKKYPQIDSFIKLFLARNVYQFYEKIGDKNNQIKFFHIYRSYYNPNDDRLDSIITKANMLNSGWLRNSVATLRYKDLIDYDSIVVGYYTDTDKSIQQMQKFITRTIKSNDFGPSFKVKCLNKLTGWLMKEGRLTEAYSCIYQAVEQVRKMQRIDEFEHLGDLSDYCYSIHDIELSRKIYNRYEKFLNEHYSKKDLEYLANYLRKFRYMEADGDWDNIESSLVDYCTEMRYQISRNIPSMTEEQREFFAKEFDAPYNYALSILQKRPTEKMANLCFDNITFRSGLLLRSNLAIRRSIESTNDKELLNEYNKLDSCRRELVFESVSGKKIFSHTGQLNDEIESLEKDIALKCTDFKTKNQIEEYGYKLVQSNIDQESAVVDLIEDKGNLFALLLKHDGNVRYIPIGNVRKISKALQESISAIYHNEKLTNYLWGKIKSNVSDCQNIYYLPVGMFNQIALGSLCVDENNNTYLCDTKRLQLISSTSDISEGENSKLAFKEKEVSLWGGIDYGNAESKSGQNDTHLKRSAVKRGDNLIDLIFAYQEVNDISSILKSKKINNHLYTEQAATEASFKQRSGKRDYILHVSTHGFFNDKANSSNPLLESGLFFAGANKYWTNDTLNISPTQEDGILYSAEISTLNFSGCSLVVLSACETGLGFCDSAEGVYGLQRAFKLSGAKMVLMSLWDVDDHATTILMTQFYEKLMEGKDADTALEESKKIVRNYYPSPEDWGGFVLLH